MNPAFSADEEAFRAEVIAFLADYRARGNGYVVSLATLDITQCEGDSRLKSRGVCPVWRRNAVENFEGDENPK